MENKSVNVLEQWIASQSMNLNKDSKSVNELKQWVASQSMYLNNG